MIQDDYIHKGLRQQMVNTLRQKGITSTKVLEAFHWKGTNHFAALYSGFSDQSIANYQKRKSTGDRYRLRLSGLCVDRNGGQSV